ncbi:MAG: trypsin-like peptidase domain-containing protein [Steroidobacteraceae bacterium]
MRTIECWVRRPVSTAAAIVLPLVICTAHGATAGGYAELVRQVAPSVVTVLVEEKREGAGERAAERAAANADYAGMSEMVRRLLSGPGHEPAHRDGDAAQGSGFIIRADGLIVTNRHVIVSARTVQVKLPSGQLLPARVIGADAATDIALLKVTAEALPALRLGSSVNISVGDAVIAIGNPFGLGQTVTAGIVSARGRTLENDPYIDFLQTDAAINFGNSGGPLLSTDGSVVGVTSAILSPSGGSVGLGFAIPAETAASVVSELEAHGRVARGYLGISAQPMTAAVARALGLDSPAGALVTALEPKGPSADTLRVGDVLLSIGNAPVTFESLGKVAGRLHPGATVEAMVMRDGRREPLSLLIGQLPDPPTDPALTGDTDTWVPSLELGVARSTRAMRRAIKANDETGGLIVTQLRPAGAAALAGLKIGDLITYAGSKHLDNIADLAAVSRPSAKQPLLLLILRDGAPRFVAVTGSDER